MVTIQRAVGGTGGCPLYQLWTPTIYSSVTLGIRVSNYQLYPAKPENRKALTCLLSFERNDDQHDHMMANSRHCQPQSGRMVSPSTSNDGASLPATLGQPIVSLLMYINIF
jgi:hypothetical protein